MSIVPQNLQYTTTHEWVKEEEDGLVTVGITDHAQCLLGDLVYVDLPELNRESIAGEENCVVESVKAASDVYCPVSGTLVEVNGALKNNPGLVNKDPYGEGWLFRVRLENRDQLKNLLTADDYFQHIAEK